MNSYNIILKNGLGDKLLDYVGSQVYGFYSHKKITGILNSKAINFVFGNSIYDFKLFNFGIYLF